MVSVFPPSRWDARPWLMAILIAALAYALLDRSRQQWYDTGYDAGYQSVIMWYADSIPQAPSEILCKQWRWLNDD
jgi:hypothetical protein